MQRVSNAYKESMKSSLRERAYIMLSFGLINQEAQQNARLARGDFAYYSNWGNIFGESTNTTVHATLEENFTKVDGSMVFLPRSSGSGVYVEEAVISKKLLTEAPFSVFIHLRNMLATDIKGLTVNFGENYPVDFDIVGSTGQTIEIRGNNMAEFVTEEVLENTNSIQLVFYAMKNPQSRVRIYSILFGYGLIYHNNDVMSSTLETYVSPIGEDVPQIDFTVQLKNYDHYFNVDNPKSAINFLETGQEMEIYYGYQLPDSEEIEWVRGNRLLCSEWESDDYTATIRCQDVFRMMDSEYYKGMYRLGGINYYDLAVAVLEDAGITNYYVDPQLKKLFTSNPIPRVKHKEALQIIANACRCVLTQTRAGAIQIKSAFEPEVSVSTDAQAEYSKIENVMNDSVKDEYASMASNYATVNGDMSLLSRQTDGNILNTGFVSAEISDGNGLFANNPKITITQDVACMYYGVKLTFGQALPAAFTIRTYNDGELVTEVEVSAGEISREMVLHAEFSEFDTMVVEFTKTTEPNNRIVLNYFSFGDITDFTMARRDMTSSPRAIKQEQVKEIIVPCYTYQASTQEESLVSEDVRTTAGSVETFFLGEPSYGFRAVLDESTSGVTIVEYGNYYVTVRYNVSGQHRLEVFGYRHKIVERYATKTLNNRGTTIKWENPLISDMNMARDLAEWLGEFYAATVEYEYDTRGNPELDVNDTIYQENEFHDNMKVKVYRQTLGFNQSFSGKVTALRMGG